MKKLMALAVLVVSLFAVPAFAAMIDLDVDCYNARWWAEYKGSDVSRNGVAYDIYAIVVNVQGNQAALNYWQVPADTQWVGLLRYVDCKGKRWTNVRVMVINTSGKITEDTGIATEWEWWAFSNTGTMMDRLYGRVCVR